MDKQGAIKIRLEKLRQCMKKDSIEAVLVSKRENYIYLSGFTGTSASLIITQERAVLLTDFRYIEQAGNQAGLFEITEYKGETAPAIGKSLKELGIRQVAYEHDFISCHEYEELLKNAEGIEFIPLKDLISKLRMIKDEYEIQQIIKAVEIADNAYTHILGYIKPGVAEIELAAELEYFMKKNGATGPSFETIVASGVRASMPHGVASEKKIEAGEVITLDFGALYNCYCSDITRTVFLGNPSPELKNIYKIVLEAQLAALESAVTGITGKELDGVARKIISLNSYGESFGHSLGHGVGLEIHEKPRVSPHSDIVMEENMVATIEPGIYVSGLGGVRIEDMVVFKGNKPMILTKSPKEPIII